MAGKKQRLDQHLVERQLADSRERAQAMILAGDVKVNGQTVTRAASTVPPEAEVTVEAPPPYVSRGGFKLAHALDIFGIGVQGETLVDVGASTGGFTDVLLQRGAKKVYAVDVGTNQLAWKLRQDDRVVSMERTNIRYLESLPEIVDGAVIDASFISLLLILPAVTRLVKPGGWIVALVKPQFEAGRGEVGKGGVVRDERVHREVLQRVLNWSGENGFAPRGCTASPILGPAGNREFLIYLTRGEGGVSARQLVDGCLPGSAA